MSAKDAPTGAAKPWRRGRCDFWVWHNGREVPCGKSGRWLVRNEIRCGEHKEAP